MIRIADLRPLLAARWLCLLDAAVALVLVFVSHNWLDAAATALRTEPYVVTKTELGPVYGVRPEVDVRAWWCFTAVLVVALLIHRRWPLPALILAVAGAAGHVLDPGELGIIDNPIDLAVPIILYSLVSRATTRRYTTIAFGAVLAAAYLMGLVWTVRHPTGAGGGSLFWVLGQGFVYALIGMLAVAIAYAWGDSTRSRRAHLRTLEQRAADLEREQHHLAALAAGFERARIARDLHDIVAHRVTGMIIQAGAARALLGEKEGRAVRALRAVEAGGREAMAELRGLLGLLASPSPNSSPNPELGPPPGPETPLAPTPGMAELPALTAHAGLPVRLRVSGDPARLPRGIDLAVYRIVQEALTNAARHSTRAGTTVDIRVEETAVRIEVVDDAPAPVGPADGAGRGLIGMRERVLPHGGTLRAGPGPDGRWRVHATVPVAATQAKQAQAMQAHAMQAQATEVR